MERRWVRILLWCLVIAVCGMIFFFSAQSGEESSKTSDRVVKWVIALMVSGYDVIALAEQREIFDTVSVLVRKLAHFGEFALLGFLVRLLLRSYNARNGGMRAWGLASLYAVSDEVHQLFRDARGASVVDVGIDSLGAAVGAALACFILWVFTRNKHNVRAERNGASATGNAERFVGLSQARG